MSSRAGAGLRERNTFRSSEGSRSGESAYKFAALEKRKKYRCYCCGSLKHLVKDCPKRVHDSESDSEGEPGTGSNRQIRDKFKVKRGSRRDSSPEQYSA